MFGDIWLRIRPFLHCRTCFVAFCLASLRRTAETSFWKYLFETKAAVGLSLNSISDKPPKGGFLEWTHLFLHKRTFLEISATVIGSVCYPCSFAYYKPAQVNYSLLLRECYHLNSCSRHQPRVVVIQASSSLAVCQLQFNSLFCFERYFYTAAMYGLLSQDIFHKWIAKRLAMAVIALFFSPVLCRILW